MIYARSGFIYFSMSYENSRFEPVKIMALKTIGCRVSKALLVIFLCHPEPVEGSDVIKHKILRLRSG